jgi:hypothetical protein
MIFFLEEFNLTEVFLGTFDTKYNIQSSAWRSVMISSSCVKSYEKGLELVPQSHLIFMHAPARSGTHAARLTQ